MNKPVTYYHIVLDRSGSMSRCWRSAMEALKNQYKQIQSTKAKYPDQDMMYSWCIFNDEIKMSKTVAPVTEHLYLPEEVQPDGLTALDDAVGLSVEFLQKQVGAEIETNPKADVVMIVITDGEENASRYFTSLGVKRMINQLEATEKWTFLFVGLDIEVENLVRDYKINPSRKIYCSISNLEDDFSQSFDNMSESFALSKNDKSKKKFNLEL
jgi:uncharacterized protein YegL